MSSLLPDDGVQVDVPPEESFDKFFEHWLTEQERLLQLLHAAAASYNADADSSSRNDDDEVERRREQQLRPLVDRVLRHYEHYYRTKAASGRRDVVPMFSPRWRSSSEKVFMWVGGWRPGMAIQLLYSKASIQLEDRMEDVLRGVRAGDLADLSADQMARVNELHGRTLKREREITEAAAQVQETIVDSDVVGLSHALTVEMNGHQQGNGEAPAHQVSRRLEAEMRPKKEGMAGVLERAEALRLETLKAVAEILRPLQAVHFLIAAAEVHLRVHEWGKTMDEANPGRQ